MSRLASHTHPVPSTGFTAIARGRPSPEMVTVTPFTRLVDHDPGRSFIRYPYVAVAGDRRGRRRAGESAEAIVMCRPSAETRIRSKPGLSIAQGTVVPGVAMSTAGRDLARTEHEVEAIGVVLAVVQWTVAQARHGGKHDVGDGMKPGLARAAPEQLVADQRARGLCRAPAQLDQAIAGQRLKVRGPAAVV
jgi:hypothetical protein